MAVHAFEVARRIILDLQKKKNIMSNINSNRGINESDISNLYYLRLLYEIMPELESLAYLISHITS